MPDISYFVARAAELLSVSNGIYDSLALRVAWLEHYHAFWLALYIDFVARFGGG